MTGLRRVVVVGTGRIAQTVHIPLLLEHPEVGEVLVMDADAATAARVADTFGIAMCEEWPASGADLALICTPPDTHARLARRALESGMHTVVEKPLAMTGADATKLCRIAASRHLRLDVCHTSRYRPRLRSVRSSIP